MKKIAKIENNCVIRHVCYWFGCFKKHVQYGLNAIGIVVFCIGGIIGSLECMMAAILISLFTNMIYALCTLKENMPYLLFLLSFFCFLLGRIGIGFLKTGSVERIFSEDTMKHILTLIFLAVVSLQIGAELSIKWIERKQNIKKEKYNRLNDKASTGLFETLVKIGFYISSAVAIAMNVEVFIYIQNNSYVETFTTFESSFPSLLRLIGGMYSYIFAILLGTCPEKKKCYLPITIFALVTGTLLLTGDRGGVILNVCLVIIYIFWRQKVDNQIWISNKLILCGLLLVPFVMAGMSFFIYLREGIDIGERSFGPQLERFFRSAGKSVRILGYGKEYIGEFPQTMYSIGGIIDYFKYNNISQIIFDITEPRPHTVEYATTMHSYAHAVTYLADAQSYLTGHGFGSSYLAELYHDLGYLGVVLVNVLFGGFLMGFNSIQLKNPFKLALLFLLVKGFYYIPRGSLVYPITSVLSITLIIVLAGYFAVDKCISIYYKAACKRTENE